MFYSTAGLTAAVTVISFLDPAKFYIFYFRLPCCRLLLPNRFEEEISGYHFSKSYEKIIFGEHSWLTGSARRWSFACHLPGFCVSRVRFLRPRGSSDAKLLREAEEQRFRLWLRLYNAVFSISMFRENLIDVYFFSSSDTAIVYYLFCCAKIRVCLCSFKSKGFRHYMMSMQASRVRIISCAHLESIGLLSTLFKYK